MDSGLVREGAKAGDVIVAACQARLRRSGQRNYAQWNLDLDCLGDEVLDFSECGQVVLRLDILGVRNHHSSDKAAKRGDAVPLADTELRVSVQRRGA